MEYLTVIVLFSGYMLPAIIGCARHHNSRDSIVVINLFFGWTLIGWIICLAWSVSGNVETYRLTQNEGHRLSNKATIYE